jgi:hypothetical protein
LKQETEILQHRNAMLVFAANGPVKQKRYQMVAVPVTPA